MERLRHDFSKHTSRLIEVSESVEHGSFMGLVQAVQTALLAHLEILTDTWEASLISAREKYTEASWSLWNWRGYIGVLGPSNMLFQMYDDLDVHLFDIVNKMADVEAGREPRWVVALRTASVPFRSLYSSFEQPKIDCKKDHSLVAIRHFLVAQQILLSLSQYNERHRSHGAPPSLRVDFAALMNVSIARLACWCLVVSSEALHIAGLLAEPSTVEGAAAALCGIQTHRFFSMLDLAELPESGPSETRSSLCEWLSASDDSSGSGEYFREVLQSPNNFAAQFFKAHDISSSTLMQCGRTRQAAHIGWKMAEWMRRNSRDAGALPLELRFVSSLLESGTKSQALVDVMKRIVPYLKDDIDFERLLSYRLYIAVHDADEMERTKYAEEFIAQLVERRQDKGSKNGRTAGHPEKSVSCHCKRLHTNHTMKSSLPISIPNFCLRVKLREVDEHVLSRRKGAVYDVHFSEREQVSRVITLNKPRELRKSISRSKSPVVSRHPIEELFLICSGQELHPGNNEITVSGLIQTRGCFLLDSVQARLLDDLVSIDIDDVKTKRLVAIFVQSTPNKLWIEESKDLLAGVVQRVNITVEAGSITLFELEIARAAGHADQWTVVLENAMIEAVDPTVTKETPNQLGKLLNRDLGELIPNVVSSLVWVLPITGELPISHRLSIDYRVKPTKESESESGDKKFLDRLYSYRDTFDLHVPK
ncbi:hypothetical protein OSTOST_10200, partial [Ostertagia ostertagi]